MSYMVGYPKDRFSRDEAYIGILLSNAWKSIDFVSSWLILELKSQLI